MTRGQAHGSTLKDSGLFVLWFTQPIMEYDDPGDAFWMGVVHTMKFTAEQEKLLTACFEVYKVKMEKVRHGSATEESLGPDDHECYCLQCTQKYTCIPRALDQNATWLHCTGLHQPTTQLCKSPAQRSASVQHVMHNAPFVLLLAACSCELKPRRQLGACTLP